MKNSPVEIVEYKGYKINIFPDTDVESPRTEMDNLGTMWCLSRTYLWGDQNGEKSNPYKFNDFRNHEEFHQLLVKHHKAMVILPVFAYVHGGTTMATTPFHCPWDSGQCGWIFVTNAQIRKEYSLPRNKKIPQEILDKVHEVLKGEVETYAQWLEGNIYGYQIEGPDGEDGDSCWGYYGSDYEESDLLPQARAAIDHELKEESIEA